MTATQATYKTEITADQLHNMPAFEAERSAAYRQADPEERGRMLTRLAGETMVAGAEGQPVSLLEAVQELATTPDKERLQASRDKVERVIETALAAKGKGEQETLLYKIIIDAGGDVTDVQKHSILSSDLKAEERGHHLSRALPSGPKQNDASKRVPDLGKGQLRT